MSYPIRCRICHKVIGCYSEPMMATCKECHEAEATRSREMWKKAHQCADAEKAKRDAEPKLENKLGLHCFKCKGKYSGHYIKDGNYFCKACDTLYLWQPRAGGVFACQQGRKTSKDTEPVIVRDHLVETLRAIPAEITYENGYQATKWGKACHDAAARIEALELELKAAQANQCDGRGSVEFQGTLASNGQPLTLCRKCNRWRCRPCA